MSFFVTAFLVADVRTPDENTEPAREAEERRQHLAAFIDAAVPGTSTATADGM